MRVLRTFPRAAAVAAALAALPAAGAAQQNPPPQQHGDHAAHAPAAQPAPAANPAAAARDSANVTVLRAEFSAAPVGVAERRAPKEKEEMEVRLRLTDPRTGGPATGLAPMAWVDVRRSDGPTPIGECRQKVGSFTEGTLMVKHGQMNIAQPVDDLNGHYLLALSRSAAIAVIDPVKGFGRTRLFTAIPLPSPGEDWAATPDDRRVFVSAPDSGVVAFVDTHAFRVIGTMKTPRPTKVALDPAARFLWVSNAAPGAWGVTVIDAEGMRVAQTLRTGAGPHAFAFSHDGALAFVTSAGAGTLSVFDARTLRLLGSVQTGQTPVDVQWSPPRKAAFVVNEGDGTVAVVDAATRTVVERIAMKPGIRSLRFAPEADPHAAHGMAQGHATAPVPGGRLAFVLNPRAGEMQIYDAVQKRVIRTLSGAPEPDQVTFTGQFAYVRAAGTASVAMIPLANPTGGAVGPHDYFPAGGTAPGSVAADNLGEILIAQPGFHDAIYAANPKERMIYSYHYMEGMPVPHGGLTTYGFTPRAIRTVTRRPREVEPGVYAATLRVEQAGDYDLVVRHPDPYLLQCFPFTVAVDPTLRPAKTVRIEAEGAERSFRVGRAVLRFRVTDTREGAALADLSDFRVQLASTAGWQQRLAARPLGDGRYEVEVEVPEGGVYYASFEIPSRNVTLRDNTPVSYRVEP